MAEDLSNEGRRWKYIRGWQEGRMDVELPDNWGREGGITKLRDYLPDV